MATYTTRTITRTVKQWIVPAASPYGAHPEEIGKAWTGAEQVKKALEKEGRLPSDLRFLTSDDDLIIEFDYEVHDEACCPGGC